MTFHPVISISAKLLQIIITCKIIVTASLIGNQCYVILYDIDVSSNRNIIAKTHEMTPQDYIDVRHDGYSNINRTRKQCLFRRLVPKL